LNVFLCQVNDAGEDVGIANAKATWSLELAGISAERIKAGLDAKYQYAPNCDEFLKHCVTSNIQDFKALPAPVNHEDNKQHVEKLNKYINERLKPKTDYHAWAKRILRDPQNFPETSVTAAKVVLGENYA
jgi:predicted transglutaminase-like cysteine proteinase